MSQPTQNEKLRAALKEIQEMAENCPSMGVGKDGPTMLELQVSEQDGHVYDGDANYHLFQKIYLTAEEALK